MIEEFEYKGKWWLPDKPQKQVSGVLKFNPNNGAILDLEGVFEDITIEEEISNAINTGNPVIKNIPTNTLLQPEIILGVSSNGENITLYKCSEIKRNYSFPSLQSSCSFYVNFIFIGTHFLRREDIKLKNIFVRYSYLDEWVNISGFDIRNSDKEEVTIKYKEPAPIHVDINENLRISIVFRTKSLPRVLNKVSIEQEALIQIETSEAMSFENYREVIYYIRNFLSLATMEPVYILFIEGMEENTYHRRTKIVYRELNIPKKHNLLSPFEMLFTFQDISDKFSFFLKNWFEKADLLRIVYDLYFSTFYNPYLYLENKFLNLIQGIETFHRRIHGGEYLPEKEYEVIYEKLISAIPKEVNNDFRNRLKEHLKYAYQFSLRKRLKEIFEEYYILNEFIKDRDVFIDLAVSTRNYYVHYTGELRKHAAEGTELLRLTEKLKLILEVCLLSSIGFSLDEIKNLFLRNHKKVNLLNYISGKNLLGGINDA
ncbi:MAG TPA: hypothetical protein GX516_00435 [Thermoanaerobacter sp.]|jgi:hypothetical protein|nr:hypothetical protein [Thermoanaerobacter sp.]